MRPYSSRLGYDRADGVVNLVGHKNRDGVGSFAVYVRNVGLNELISNRVSNKHQKNTSRHLWRYSVRYIVYCVPMVRYG